MVKVAVEFGDGVGEGVFVGVGFENVKVRLADAAADGVVRGCPDGFIPRAEEGQGGDCDVWDIHSGQILGVKGDKDDLWLKFTVQKRVLHRYIS